jgi:hypothetical protein
MACFIIADNCMNAANEICANGKNETEAGFQNSSAGGPIPPKPIEIDDTDDVIMVVDENDPFWICLGPPYIMMFVMGSMFLVGRQATNK